MGHVLFSVYVLHTDIGNVLGWISILFWLSGFVANVFRYKWYKKLIVHQVGLIKSKMSMQNARHHAGDEWVKELKIRNIDIAMVGILAMALEDYPMFLVALVIGGTNDAAFGYNNFAVIVCLAVSFVAIAVKIGLLFGAFCTKADKASGDAKGDVMAVNRKQSSKKNVQMSD